MSCLLGLCATLCFFSPPLGSIKELEDEQLSLQSDSEHYTDQVTNLNYVLVWCFIILLYLIHLPLH